MIVFIALCQTFSLIVNAGLPLSLGFARFDVGGGGALSCRGGVQPTLVDNSSLGSKRSRNAC